MALTIAQFCAIFLFTCLSGAFAGLATSFVWGVWGGIKPLARRLNDVESDLEALTGRFSKHQKRAAADKSAEVREKKLDPEVQQVIAAAAAIQNGDGQQSDIEYYG